MYEAFFGLKERPFELTPNPRYLFLSPKHREALSNLRYGLTGQRGITLLLGEAGTGKTTLLRSALAAEQRNGNRYVLVTNPTLERREFYEYLAMGFRLSDEAARSKARFLFELQDEVQARHAEGGVTTLVVDEAQSLSRELLEEMRLLANMETATSKLLNLVLVGQPELADRLNDGSLRQLKQRVALRCELKPLALPETAAYLAGRLRIAGAQVAEVFTREAVIAIYEYSRGIPRTISVVADNALLTGFALSTRPVTADIVHEVARDFDLLPWPADPPPSVSADAAPIQTMPGAPARATTNAGTASAPTPAPLGTADRPSLFSQWAKARRFRFF